MKKLLMSSWLAVVVALGTAASVLAGGLFLSPKASPVVVGRTYRVVSKGGSQTACGMSATGYTVQGPFGGFSAIASPTPLTIGSALTVFASSGTCSGYNLWIYK